MGRSIIMSIIKVNKKFLKITLHNIAGDLYYLHRGKMIPAETFLLRRTLDKIKKEAVCY